MTASFWRGSHYLEWILDKQDVAKHRSIDYEILGSEEDYQKVMIFFSNVIQTFGKGVDVRQQVIATALVYFRRFYAQYSFKSVDPWLMSPSCLFLASKIEEFGVISQKVLMNTCKNVVQSLYSAYFGDSSYPYRPADVLECEFILMETLDCSMVVFHPYRSLLNILDNLKPDLNQSYDLILQKTWKIINDSFKTDLCLFFPPYTVALGCLLVAISTMNNPQSANNRNSNAATLISNTENWFAELQVDPDLILEVSRYMVSLYDLLSRFDEAVEMPVILGNLPKPLTQSQINSANGGQTMNANNPPISSNAGINKPNNNPNPINTNANINPNQNQQYMNPQVSIGGHNPGHDVILNSGGGPPAPNQMIMQQHPMAPSNYSQQQQNNPQLHSQHQKNQQQQQHQHQQVLQQRHGMQQSNPNFMPQQF